jgi:hypothetical protein
MEHNPMGMATWRLELFFKSSADLRLQIPFLRQHVSSFQGVNITNKSKDDDLLGSVKLLREHLPELDVHVHVSLKYQRSTKEAVFSETNFPLGNPRDLQPQMQRVIGEWIRKKGPQDTITTLEALATPGRPFFAAWDTPLRRL